MNTQPVENHDDLNEMQKLTELQEAEFKQHEHEEKQQQANGPAQQLQEAFLKRSRENSIDSARSRSRSTNERKRNYNQQQFSEQKKDGSPSQGIESSVNASRQNRFVDQTEGSILPKQHENDPNKLNNATINMSGVNSLNNINSSNPADYAKTHYNQGLQQLQDMATKVDIPAMKLDNQSGYRHARRLYIGNIPETINQEYLSEWLYRSLEAAGGLQPNLPSENPIVKCEIDPKGRFAFTELRSIEETTSLLQLDGIILWHRQLRIRRPTEYEKFPQVQGGFDPTQTAVPKLNFDLFKTVGIVIIPTVVDDGPNKVFLANLPTKMDELMILDELKLRDMGEIKAFHLVKDNQTNQSKGYAFFEFKDPSLTERCIEALHGMSYAGRTLTCKRSQIGGMGNRQGHQGRNNNNNNNNNNNRGGMNNQNNQGGNNLQKQFYLSDGSMDQNIGGMQTNEGSGYFPNYSQTTQGLGLQSSNLHGSNGKNNAQYNNMKRRNYNNTNNSYGGLPNSSNTNGHNNNGNNMNQNGNMNGSGRRYQNGNSGQNQQGQYNNNNNNNNNSNNSGSGSKFTKGLSNSNNKMGKTSQWNASNQDGMDNYYDNTNQQAYDANSSYSTYQNQPSNFMMHDQQNSYQ